METLPTNLYEKLVAEYGFAFAAAVRAAVLIAAEEWREEHTKQFGELAADAFDALFNVTPQ